MTRNIDALRAGASPEMQRNIAKAMAGAFCPHGVGQFGYCQECIRAMQNAISAKHKPAIRIPKPREIGAAEDAYRTLLIKEFQTAEIRYEGMSFRLNSGALYTPDFTVWEGESLILAVEVKGIIAKRHSAARSILAFKTAASEWRAIQFRYAAKQKDGSWNITEVNS